MSLHLTVTFARLYEVFEDSHRFLAGGAASTLRFALKASLFFISQRRRSNDSGARGNQSLFTDEETPDVSPFKQRDLVKGTLFAKLLPGKGVYVRPNCLWHALTTHAEADVKLTLAARCALAALK